MKLTRSDKGPLIAFMAPALIVMVLFFVIPVIYVVAVSFLKWNGISDPAFNNVKNFSMLLKDKSFFPAPDWEILPEEPTPPEAIP